MVFVRMCLCQRFRNHVINNSYLHDWFPCLHSKVSPHLWYFFWIDQNGSKQTSWIYCLGALVARIALKHNTEIACNHNVRRWSHNPHKIPLVWAPTLLTVLLMKKMYHLYICGEEFDLCYLGVLYGRLLYSLLLVKLKKLVFWWHAKLKQVVFNSRANIISNWKV